MEFQGSQIFRNCRDFPGISLVVNHLFSVIFFIFPYFPVIFLLFSLFFLIFLLFSCYFPVIFPLFSLFSSCNSHASFVCPCCRYVNARLFMVDSVLRWSTPNISLLFSKIGTVSVMRLWGPPFFRKSPVVLQP